MKFNIISIKSNIIWLTFIFLGVNSITYANVLNETPNQIKTRIQKYSEYYLSVDANSFPFFHIQTNNFKEKTVQVCWGPRTLTRLDEGSLKTAHCESLHVNGLNENQIQNFELWINWQINLERFAQTPNDPRISALRTARLVLCETGAKYVFVNVNHALPVVFELLAALN